MKHTYAVVPVTEAHITELIGTMRQADRQEVEASSGKDHARVLRESVAMSEMCWTGLIDGQVACIFGCGSTSLIDPVGIPWLLGSDLITLHAKPFLRRSRPYVREMQGRWVWLENWVDARNDKSIAWLKWLGFAMDEAKPYGAAGLPFHRFYMRSENV